MLSQMEEFLSLWLNNSPLFILYMCVYIYTHMCYLFICFWLCWVFVAAHGLSLVVASRDYLVVVQGSLIVVASLIAEHRL